MSFMNKFGLIIVCDLKGEYYVMIDVIYKVLNDIIVDDWDIIIGGDSYICMFKGVVFGVDFGIVVLVLVIGEVIMLIFEFVKVIFKGEMKDYMDFCDVVYVI